MSLEQENARLREALEHLTSVITAAGVMNLSRGVQLGQTAWYCKATAAMEHAGRALASPTPDDGARGEPATHVCRICGAQWRLNPAEPDKYPKDHPFHHATWTLRSPTCGKCCDNVAMGDQIEPLPPRPAGQATEGA